MLCACKIVVLSSFTDIDASWLNFQSGRGRLRGMMRKSHLMRSCQSWISKHPACIFLERGREGEAPLRSKPETLLLRRICGETNYRIL
ncbi:hypothetical protein TNCV_338231 [Trichonephila clavipes]|nr:hypothetical protein TNCV_338231 [Trichonephila clavipes]